jgi:hypothetical protein
MRKEIQALFAFLLAKNRNFSILASPSTANRAEAHFSRAKEPAALAKGAAILKTQVPDEPKKTALKSGRRPPKSADDGENALTATDSPNLNWPSGETRLAAVRHDLPDPKDKTAKQFKFPLRYGCRQIYLYFKIFLNIYQ